MMKKVFSLLLALLLLLLAACQASPSPEPSESPSEPPSQPSAQPLAREIVDGWSITSGWKVDSVSTENGDALTFTGSGDEAYNTSFTLRDAWDISAVITPAGGTQEVGFVLGTSDFAGIGQIFLRIEDGKAVLSVQYLAGGVFNELLKSSEFAYADTVTLKVSKLTEDRKLVVTVSDGDTELYSGVAEEIPSTFSRLMSKAGLSAAGGAAFTEVKILTYSTTGGVEIAIEAIDPGPHVDNPDYIFGNAVYNVVNGEERIIVDSNQEGYAWYIGTEFSGDWTVKCRVQIGNFNGSEAGCARFSFGGERLIDDDGELDVPDMFGMYTVKVDVNNNFYFENSQQLKNDSWTTKAGGSSWTQIYYPIFDMIVSHKAGEDTLHLQFIDLNGDVIYTTTTRDYDPGYLDGVKYFSFFVWQSQAQFTKMEYLHEFTVLEDKPAAPPPGPSQLDYTPYTDFGTTEDTQDWDLGGVYKFKSSVNGDVLGADGVGMGDGARASYQGKLSGDWSIETAMRFENAADIYSGRVYFYGDDGGLRGIVSAKMNQSGEAWMEAQMLSGDWSDLIAAPSPAVVPTKDVWVSIGKKAGGVLVIRALDEQGTQIYYGETNAMTNIGEVTAFALVLDETCAVFDRVLVGTDAGGIVSMGAPTADFGGAKDSPVWTLGDDVFAKAGSREGEALLFNSDINTTATAGLGNAAFSLSMDILFSKTYNDGRFVSRFFLRDEDDGLLAIVDFEADSSRQFMINAQKFENNEWGAIAGSGDWQPMVGRNASLTISRAGGADKLRIKAVDLAGNTLYDMETAAFNGAAAIRKVEINGNQVIAVLDNVVIR